MPDNFPLPNFSLSNFSLNTSQPQLYNAEVPIERLHQSDLPPLSSTHSSSPFQHALPSMNSANQAYAQNYPGSNNRTLPPSSASQQQNTNGTHAEIIGGSEHASFNSNAVMFSSTNNPHQSSANYLNSNNDNSRFLSTQLLQNTTYTFGANSRKTQSKSKVKSHKITKAYVKYSESENTIVSEFTQEQSNAKEKLEKELKERKYIKNDEELLIRKNDLWLLEARVLLRNSVPLQKVAENEKIPTTVRKYFHGSGRLQERGAEYLAKKVVQKEDSAT